LITLRDGQLVITGEQFDVNGNLRVTWKSLIVHYDGDSIVYLYRAEFIHATREKSVLGMAVLNFPRTAPQAHPTIVNGYWIDFCDPYERIAFCGEKVVAAEDLACLRDPSKRRSFVVSLFKRDYPRIACEIPAGGSGRAAV
jgi:hypothetical protein